MGSEVAGAAAQAAISVLDDACLASIGSPAGTEIGYTSDQRQERGISYICELLKNIYKVECLHIHVWLVSYFHISKRKDLQLRSLHFVNINNHPFYKTQLIAILCLLDSSY